MRESGVNCRKQEKYEIESMWCDTEQFIIADGWEWGGHTDRRVVLAGETDDRPPRMPACLEASTLTCTAVSNHLQSQAAHKERG